MIDKQTASVWTCVVLTVVSLVVMFTALCATQLNAQDKEEEMHPRIFMELISMFEETGNKLRGDTTGTTIAALSWSMERLRREHRGSDDPLVLINITSDIAVELTKFRHQSRRRLEKMR